MECLHIHDITADFLLCLQRLLEILDTGSLNCTICSSNTKKKYVSLEDFEYQKRVSNKGSRGEDITQKGFYYCLCCHRVVCSYHLEHEGIPVILNFTERIIQCLTCNCEIQTTSNDKLSYQSQFYFKMHKTIQLFNLIRMFPQKTFIVCKICKVKQRIHYRCNECKSYCICETCFKNTNISENHRHDKKLFSKEIFPLWIIPRLVEGNSAIECLFNIFKVIPERPIFGVSVGVNENTIHWTSFQDFEAEMIHFGTGLLHWFDKYDHRLLCNFDKYILIMTEGDYISFVIDYSVLFYGFIPIRIHHESSIDVITYLAKEYHLKVFVFPSMKSDSFNSFVNSSFFQNNTDHLYFIFCDLQVSLIQIPSHVHVISMQELSEIGRNKELSSIHSDYCFRKPDDIFMVLCSSGSTGSPKSFPMSDLGITQQLRRTTYGASEFPNVTVAWNYSDRINSIFHIYTGGRMFICNNSSPSYSSLFDKIKLCSPSFLVCPPIFWHSVYQYYCNSCLQERVLHPSKSMDEIQEEQKNQIKLLFGRRLKSITTGGAKIQDDALQLLKDCFLNVNDRYGSTETGAIASNGILYKNIRYRLQSWENYSISDYPHPQGELIIKINNQTWHATGDIVKLLAPNRIEIIDRKINTKKMLHGEWINLEYIENMISSTFAFIQQIILFASQDHLYPIAFIYPNEFELNRFRTQHHLQNYDDQSFVLFLQNQLLEGKHLRSFEIPSHFLFLEEGFTINNGCLTPTLKLCRRNIYSKYEREIISLFASQNKSYSSHSSGDDSNFNNSIMTILEQIFPNFDNTSKMIHFDSLMAVQFVRKFKEINHDNFTLNPAALTGLQTSIKEFQTRLQEYSSNPMKNSFSLYKPLEYIDIHSEKCKLDALLSGLINSKFSCNQNQNTNIFLTGASGFLGVFVLYFLLNENDTSKIWCLVRGNSKLEATEKLLLQLKRVCMHIDKTLFDKWKERIIVVHGSLNLPFFGLDESDFLDLSIKMNCIFHVGAIVSGLTRYHELYSTNVQGTMECIRLSVFAFLQKKTDKISRLNFISSGAVFNGYPDGKIKEDAKLEVTSSQMYMDGYSRSKWMSDYLCIRARDKYSLPITIFRPAFISADMNTGISNTSDFDNRLIMGIVKMGSMPKIDNKKLMLDQNPVNWVAKSIVKIGLHSTIDSKCYHFMNPKGSPSVYKILSVLNQVHFENFNQYLDILPYEKWKTELHCLPFDNPIFPLVNFFGESFPARDGNRLDISNTLEELSTFRIEPPQISEVTTRKWLLWLFNSQKLIH